MCAGAVYWSGIARVVYALSEIKLLALTGNHPENPTLSLPCRDVFAHGQRRIEVVGPMLEDEAAVEWMDDDAPGRLGRFVFPEPLAAPVQLEIVSADLMGLCRPTAAPRLSELADLDAQRVVLVLLVAHSLE